ncbi:MAG TPA: DUF445 family protein [Gemmatimonadales bacterium]|jgi:uncharacterized membrane-anchored protein YjiN (DUF445 family)|nr:DUF445 family protein [Gemmatimonadales bacterium]
MAESVWLQGLVTVGVGAISGGITNAVAVWMLFHPYERRGIGPLAIHGAIPKNKGRLAKSIGKTVGQRLLTEEDLARQLGAPGLREAFDRAIAGFLDRALNTPRGALRDELPAPLVAEIEASLEPLAAALAGRLAEFVTGPGFADAVEKYIQLDRWVEEGVARPELEQAVRRFVAAQRARLLLDERPLLERLPEGLIAALQQAIADYLPIAVERLGALLADPEARERIRTGLKRFLDRAIKNLMVHERVMAKLVITENRLDRLLDGLEEGGFADLAEVLETPDFRAQVARAVNDAVVRFLRAPLADRLWALGPERLDGVERTAADYILAALRAPETRAWAVARAHDAIALGRTALAGEAGRQHVAEAAHRAVRALLERPIGRPADLLPADAEARLRRALTEPLWGWMQRQVPVIVSQLSVQEMVEQKVLGFSVQRMEEIIKNVTQRELRLIVQLGYVLGALVGLVAFGLNRLIG